MTVTRILFLAQYRVPHAAFSLQFDHYLQGIDRTVIATPMTQEELEPVWQRYSIDSSRFEYVNDSEIYAAYPEVNNWVFADDYRGWWLRQQAIKLAYLDFLDYDVAVMQDPDTFMIKPYSPLVNNQLNMLALMDTTQGSYHGVFEAITGIPHPSPHCFVTELCAVRKTDFSALKQHIQSRWPDKKWLDAIIDAVPGMPTVPPWGTGNIIKWFSEYELLGNWATLQGQMILQPQQRYEYGTLANIAGFDYNHNAVCDAVPDLSRSMQIDWATLDIENFDYYKNLVTQRTNELDLSVRI
jgi:hypothetical protein